ncbi:Rv3654c family TadE-like protein [Actinoplanes sp. NPDC049265]|uniref:Rv3654c family TadE-like protein n=1 Tax=Actinoplanes sp. NPDC049265 TaxID=3363902 RepID=UPI00372159C5
MMRRPDLGGCATPGRRSGERGAASILLLAIGLVLVAAGLAGAMVANARVARHEARAAADFGALAGATRVVEGEESACVEAARLVAANGAAVESCRQDGLEIVVHVTVTSRHFPKPARAAARAGPLSAPGQESGPLWSEPGGREVIEAPASGEQGAGVGKL